MKTYNLTLVLHVTTEKETTTPDKARSEVFEYLEDKGYFDIGDLSLYLENVEVTGVYDEDLNDTGVYDKEDRK